MWSVLVVEDDVNLAELYREELQEEGYAVVVARDTNSALQLAKEVAPAVIVTEIHLREDLAWDGTSHVPALRAHCPHIPVIINAATEPPPEIRDAGHPVIYKSGDLTQLKSCIGHFVRGQRRELATNPG